ncbi:hypothetical protein ACFU7Z_30220 [Kitasatospora sp. NPDC057518]|uniref:hypothetical protein n=1 Tax=Kitasatospora sp. NPDC057518 TaxID=3346155 RepID=UPI0036D172CA
MNGETVTQTQAYAAARLVLDAARLRRDSMPIRAAAEAAATSERSADEVELILRRLHARGRAQQRPARLAA